ncbi:MAG: DUF362 domain-containing protein [Bacteroidetes bacterium]|nr:DUF362 domain-containing protein [Bacteroidota bacterium]
MKSNIPRRNFLKIAGLAGIGLTLLPSWLRSMNKSGFTPPDPTATNIADALKYPRNEISMPGKFPGKAVQVTHANSVTEDKPDEQAAYGMLSAAMLALTGASSIAEAWGQFVAPSDRIGLKVNPVAGPDLSTSPAVVKAVIRQLQEAGIPNEQILIWDRREFQLTEAGFTSENFPGIQIIGTEYMDADGSFKDAEGNFLSWKRVDKDWYYWADCEEEYDEESLPYMVNTGKYSYFSAICTQMVDKIINIPILKNAGNSVTLCMKNLAYGAITNTGRLHKTLWSETSAEVCAFPPLRDKVVLNIVDGIKGCFQGGPGANPQFFTFYNTLIVGSDPVAVDRVGYELVLKKRLAEGVQKEETPKGKRFMELARDLKLGVSDLEKIEWTKINLPG